MSDAVLRTEGLTKAYGSNVALDGVTLEVPPGVTGLLGPNGAGKSTMLQCVLGLLPDFRGKAEVLGLDARRQRRAIRRRVGFMPELDAYLFGISGLHAVRYLAQLSGLPRREALRRAHEVLTHVGLGEAIYRKVDGYSTGMRQRFKLAQAIAHDPDLVFLDEPLAGLDPDGRKEVRDLIHDLAVTHHKHVLWSLHLLPDVQRVAEQVVVLHRGKSRGLFRMDELLAREGRFQVEVEGDGSALVDVLSSVEDGSLRLEGEKRAAASSLVEARTSYEVVGPTDLEAGHLLAICHHAGVRVRRVVPLAETLEDVFLRLLGDDLEPEPEPPQQELEDEGPVAEHAADDTYPGNGSGAA